jgi:hypothetical protein
MSNTQRYQHVVLNDRFLTQETSLMPSECGIEGEGRALSPGCGPHSEGGGKNGRSKPELLLPPLDFPSLPLGRSDFFPADFLERGDAVRGLYRAAMRERVIRALEACR